MKRHSLWMRTLSFLFVLVLTLGLCACPAGEPTEGTSGSTTGNSLPPSPDDVTDAIYADGAPIDGAGATLAEDAFASVTHTPDEANAISVENLSSLFRSNSIKAGATYLLTADTPATVSVTDRIYNGQGAIIIAPNGVVIEGAMKGGFSNITFVGAVTVKDSQGISFASVEIANPNGTALSATADTDGVILTDCRLSGKQAIENAAKNFAVISSTIIAEEKGAVDSGAENSVYMGCVFETCGDALSVAAGGAQIRENSFTLPATATAVTLQGEGENNLIALNEIKGAQASVRILGTVNTSVVLNSAVTVWAENATSLYICDNSLGGRLRTKNNNYFLADGNTYPEDGLDHTALQVGNQNTNGDSITDVDARLDVGVNEELLPHVNYDLFHEMPRRATVREGAADTGLRVGQYILEKALTSPYVILLPGVYSVTGHTAYEAKHSNTTVYAYGVYVEMERGNGNLGAHITVSGADKIGIKGMTVGYERQSCGQVYVLAKLPNNKVLVVTGAGMDNEFGNTNTSLYNVTAMGAQRAGTFFAYCDTSFMSIRKLSSGLMEMSVDYSVHEMLEVGDILTCRSQQGGSTVGVSKSTDILFKDFTLYGSSGGLACYETENRTAVTYYRMANTTKSAPIIDEETYTFYKDLEAEYGVSLEVYVDELGRFRGSPPHIGSIDATHVVGCAQGSVAISCLFENMCDDATNQHSMHARLDSLTDNGDGTATVVYRGNYSVVDYSTYTSGAGGYCKPFIVGDRVYIYTAAGQLVCDTTALSATEVVRENGKVKQVVNQARLERCRQANPGLADSTCITYYYSITIDSAAVNFDALVGYNLTLQTADDQHKVLVDNMSMASNGFIFDNCLSQNIRSRGLLIKASEGKIVNCTFRNIGMACAAILYEIYWGESGVSENLTVSRNVMDHVGYFTKYTTGNEDRYSPISIEGLGSRVEEDYLLYKNIEITDNIIRNRTTKYAIYINSARDVIVKNNDFGDRAGGEDPENPTLAIHLNGAMNVEISGNKYSSLDLPVEEKFVAEHVKHIFGSDVEWEGESLIPDKE